MTRSLLARLAVAAFSGYSMRIGAATVSTSATAIFCGIGDPDCAYTDPTALRPFDSALGTLTGITLQIDATFQGGYSISFADFGGPSEQTGSATVSFYNPFNTMVNGTTYSVPVSGSQDISLSGAMRLADENFTGTASQTFVLDPSLFSLFVDTSNSCNTLVHAWGICATILTLGGYGASNVNNLTFYHCAGTCIADTAKYTVTYSYDPPRVPELSTWAMTLLGFAGIEMAVRRSRKPSLAPLA